MENFFSNALDYNLFKKALKSTDGETVVINILSSDESLKTPVNNSKKQRKSMSSKFEPSPFGKFFGSKQASPVDMSDFSGWKNKNYRKTEESFSSYDDDESSFFSLSNYMKEKSPDTYNELDQARNDIVKPITQLDPEDPTFKKFSLDGYMHKLEESILAKDKFTQNEDLLEPIVSSDDYIDHSTQNLNKSQDENFFDFNRDVESFAFDEYNTGSSFKMDNDELDKVKDRLARLEMEARNLKLKSTEKLITGDELPGTSTSTSQSSSIDDEDKDTFDDLLMSKTDKVVDSLNEIEKAEGAAKKPRKLNEVVMHTETEKVTGSSLQRPVIISTDDINTDEPLRIVAETKDNDTLRREDVLTKEDFRDMTNEFMTKFTEILGKPQQNSMQEEYDEEFEQQPQPFAQPQMQEGFVDYNELLDYKNNQDEMKLKINELVESKNRTEKETQEKLKKIEEEKQKIDEEYKNKLKEMEESYSKKYEEFKQKMYLDKLSSEREIKKAESKIKIKKEEIESGKLSYKQVGAILKKELKSNFNISNLEMEKKLLEVTSQIEKEENIKLKEDLSKQAKKPVRKAPVVVVREKVQNVASAPAPTPAPPPAKKPTKPRTKKKTKRKIDSDIIGGISF